MKFPSVKWFEAMQAEAAADADRFRRLGFCDAAVRIQVEGPKTQSFVLAFNGYGCSSVVGGKAADDAAVDFTLAAPLAVWQEMIENIQQNGVADLQHTLNYLQLPSIIRLEAEDQGQADLFYRFSQTFQAFFDQAAKIPATFPTAQPV